MQPPSYGQPMVHPNVYPQYGTYPMNPRPSFTPDPKYRPRITVENDMRVLRLDISTPEARANLVLWYKVIVKYKGSMIKETMMK